MLEPVETGESAEIVEMIQKKIEGDEEERRQVDDKSGLQRMKIETEELVKTKQRCQSYKRIDRRDGIEKRDNRQKRQKIWQ